MRSHDRWAAANHSGPRCKASDCVAEQACALTHYCVRKSEQGWCAQGLEGLLQQVEEQDGPDEARFGGLPALSGAPSAPPGGRRGKPLGSAADWVKMSRAPTA